MRMESNGNFGEPARTLIFFVVPSSQVKLVVFVLSWKVTLEIAYRTRTEDQTYRQCPVPSHYVRVY
jgi:hypothetical protein